MCFWDVVSTLSQICEVQWIVHPLSSASSEMRTSSRRHAENMPEPWPHKRYTLRRRYTTNGLHGLFLKCIKTLFTHTLYAYSTRVTPVISDSSLPCAKTPSAHSRRWLVLIRNLFVPVPPNEKRESSGPRHKKTDWYRSQPSLLLSPK